MIKLNNFSRIIDLQNYKFQCFLPLNRPLTLNVSRLKMTIRGTKFDLEKVKYFCQIFLFCWSFGNCWLLNRPGRQFVVVLFYANNVSACVMVCGELDLNADIWHQLHKRKNNLYSGGNWMSWKIQKQETKSTENLKVTRKTRNSLKNQGPQDLNMNRPEPGAGLGYKNKE